MMNNLQMSSHFLYKMATNAIVACLILSTKVHGFAPTIRTHDTAFHHKPYTHIQNTQTYPPSLRPTSKLYNAALLDISFLPNTLENASSAYSYALAHYQLETQSVSTGILSGLGDTIAQLTESPSSSTSDDNDDDKQQQETQKREMNMKRTTAFIIKGLGAGIIWHFWYNLADACGDSIFGDDHSSNTIQRTALSILLEQFIACPIVYALWDIPIPALLNGSGFVTIVERVRDRLGGLLFSNAKVWTFANTIIYNVPIEWRVLAMNFADLGWQVIVSQAIMGEEEDDSSSSSSKETMPQ